MIKPPNFVGLATIGVPTIGMILLFLLPFYDRGPERHPLRRPMATLTGIFVILRDGLPDLPGRQRRPADGARRSSRRRRSSREGKAALQQFYFGRAVVAQSGCEACHKIGDDGNDGPGPELTHIGARVPPDGDRAHARQPDGADAVYGSADCRRSSSARSSPSCPT